MLCSAADRQGNLQNISSLFAYLQQAQFRSTFIHKFDGFWVYGAFQYLAHRFCKFISKQRSRCMCSKCLQLDPVNGDLVAPSTKRSHEAQDALKKNSASSRARIHLGASLSAAQRTRVGLTTTLQADSGSRMTNHQILAARFPLPLSRLGRDHRFSGLVGLPTHPKDSDSRRGDTTFVPLTHQLHNKLEINHVW